ncbi:MAG: DmsC/YnfH family molybdoenzyme membrane anchor subunit [Limisphaerales bacterium]
MGSRGLRRLPWLVVTEDASYPNLQTLVDRYLSDQRSVSAVDQFSRWHDLKSRAPDHREHDSREATSCATVGRALESHYRKLLPATRPASGQQYAFEVDLDSCSGCKACVTACHSLNGLEEGESWRSVGLLLDATSRRDEPGSPVAVQHVTAACHHCVDPACLNGCPVLAYEKDPATGIVRHLDDQCIGCSYCTLMCPYEVPRYSSRLGIVRKCDLCHGRLAAGEAPACAQGCPNEAIRVTLVQVAELEPLLRAEKSPESRAARFLPDAPDPSITIPTTRYVSASGRGRPLSMSAADRTHAVPAEAHTPLTLFLVLTQVSVGLAIAASLGVGVRGVLASHAWLVAFGVQVVALAIASAHLGQPTRAWRAFLGWRRSWFSREVIAFGAYSAALGLPAMSQAGLPIPPTVASTATVLAPWIGLAAIGTSVMIYAATRRRFWSAKSTATRFLGTTFLAVGVSHASPAMALTLVVTALIVKILAEFQPVLRPDPDPSSESARTRLLLRGPLRSWTLGRLALAAMGVCAFLPPLVAASGLSTGFAAVGAALLLAGEFLERHLFFVAVAPPRMPGAVPT